MSKELGIFDYNNNLTERQEELMKRNNARFDTLDDWFAMENVEVLVESIREKYRQVLAGIVKDLGKEQGSKYYAKGEDELEKACMLSISAVYSDDIMKTLLSLPSTLFFARSFFNKCISRNNWEG